MNPRETSAGRGARVLGSPGEGARLAGFARAAWPLALVPLVAGYFLGAALPWPRLSTSGAGLGLVILGAGLWLSISPVRRRLRAFFTGAQGEQRVAARLARLPEGFTILHGVRLPGAGRGPGADLDHVVVGPSGIWVVETKYWRGSVTLSDGKLLCDGRSPSRPPIEQARAASQRLARALLARLGTARGIRTVVCFAGDNNDCPNDKIGDVYVCHERNLVGKLSEPCPQAPGPESLDDVVRVIGGWLPDETRRDERVGLTGMRGESIANETKS